MKKCLILAILFMPMFLFGQKTKLIKDKQTNEIYYVLKSDNSTKHGEYQKIGNKNVLLIKGYYKNGVIDSIWEFSNSMGEVVQKFDFTTKSLIYYKISESDQNKLYKVITDSASQYVLLDRPPIFVGGEDYFMQELMANIQYPLDAFTNGISGRVSVSFVIDKNGETDSFKVLKPIGHGLDEEAVRVLKSLPNNWLPGIYKGQPVNVEMIYPINFTLK